jgi:hypothetical protein
MKTMPTIRVGTMKPPTLRSLGTMSVNDLRVKLRAFAARSKCCSGRLMNGELLSEALPKFFNELLDSTTNPEKIRQRNEFLARAEADPVARQQLASVRVELFNNYLLATNHMLDFFFEVVNLKLDEKPVAQNTTMQPVKCYYVGDDGEPRMVRVDRDDQDQLINMFFLSTDLVRYKKVDLYRGTIVDAALATLRMSYDMANQIDALLFNLLDSKAFGTFVFTGKKQNFPYLANPRIKTANLPNTNDVTVPGANTTSTFGFPTLTAIVNYCNRWSGAFLEGNLQPTGRILVPPPHIADITNGITPANTPNNKVADELMLEGWAAVHWLGRDWTFIPDNTLDPSKFICYPEFNLKPGRAYFKPELDEEKVSTNVYELDKKNEEERWMRKPFGPYINNSNFPKIARFKYCTATNYSG